MSDVRWNNNSGLYLILLPKETNEQLSDIKKRYCETEQGRVCYWLSDSARPALETASSSPTTIRVVLFLHGLGGSGRYWFSYLEKLAQKYGTSRIVGVAPDLLGFGASAKPNLEYTADLQLKVIRAVLDDCIANFRLAAGPSDFHFYLVGHSMGGVLALLLAGQLAEGQSLLRSEPTSLSGFLSGLLLLGVPYPSPEHDMKREVLRSVSTRLMLGHPLVCWIVHHSLTTIWPLVLFLNAKNILKTGLPQPILADYMKHTCQSYISNANHLIFDLNLEPTMDLLAAKSLTHTVLVYSKADQDAPLWHGRQLAQRLPDSELRVLEDTSHTALGLAALEVLGEL